MASRFEFGRRARLGLAALLALAGTATALNKNQAQEPAQPQVIAADTTFIQDTVTPAVTHTVKRGDALERITKKHFGLTNARALRDSVIAVVGYSKATLPHIEIDNKRVRYDSTTNTSIVENAPDGIPGDVLRINDVITLQPAQIVERAVITPIYAPQAPVQKRHFNYMGWMLLAGAAGLAASVLRKPREEVKTVVPKPAAVRKTTELYTQQETAETAVPDTKPSSVTARDETIIPSPAQTHFEQQYNTPIEIAPPPNTTHKTAEFDITVTTRPTAMIAPIVETPVKQPRPKRTSLIDMPAIVSTKDNIDLSSLIEAFKERALEPSPVKPKPRGDEVQEFKTPEHLKANTGERAAAREPIAPLAKPEDTSHRPSVPLNEQYVAQEMPRVELPIETETAKTPAPMSRHSMTPRGSMALERIADHPDTTEEFIRSRLQDPITYRCVKDQKDHDETWKRTYYNERVFAIMRLATASLPTVKKVLLEHDPDVAPYIQNLTHETLTPILGIPVVKKTTQGIMLALALGSAAPTVQAQPLEERLKHTVEARAAPTESTITYIPKTHTAHVHTPKEAPKTRAEKVAHERASYTAQMRAQGMSDEQIAFTFGEQGDMNIPTEYKTAEARADRRAYVAQARARGDTYATIGRNIHMSSSTAGRDNKRFAVEHAATLS